MPALVCNRAFVDERFGESTEEHDVAEFLQQLIHGMSRVEAAASRALENPYGSAVENGAVITHVERLFGFLEEGRRRCAGCRRVNQSFEKKVMLQLPSVAAEEKEVTVGDLLLRYCAEEKLEQPVFCDSCRCLKKHEAQRRVAEHPNVLVLRVSRAVAGEPTLRRFAVRPELRLEMPGIGRMDFLGSCVPRRCDARARALHLRVSWS